MSVPHEPAPNRRPRPRRTRRPPRARRGLQGRPGICTTTRCGASTVVLCFATPSTWTRLSFETAIARLGGTPTVVGPGELQLGRGETIEDTARVVSQFASAFVIRTPRRRRRARVRGGGIHSRGQRTDRRSPTLPEPCGPPDDPRALSPLRRPEAGVPRRWQQRHQQPAGGRGARGDGHHGGDPARVRAVLRRGHPSRAGRGGPRAAGSS